MNSRIRECPICAHDKKIRIARRNVGRQAPRQCRDLPHQLYPRSPPHRGEPNVWRVSSNTHSLLAAFESAAEKCGIFQERILEQCLTSAIPDLFVDYVRLRDLTIVPVPEGDYRDQWYAESFIFGSGRPTVILPETPKRAGAFVAATGPVADRARQKPHHRIRRFGSSLHHADDRDTCT